MDDPPGTNLSVSQLLSALKWKLEHLPPVRGTLKTLSKDESDVMANEIISQREMASFILSMLGNRHNFLQPINRFPIEIIAKIFDMVQDHMEALFPPATSDELKNANSWLSATQVCQHWRQCSLAFPQLWQNVRLGPETRDDGRLGELFISNSKLAPLFYTHVMKSKTRRDIFASNPTSLTTFFQSLTDNSDRIELFHIWSAHFIQTRIWEFLDKPLPSLRSLHLDLTAMNFIKGAETIISLPVLLGGQTSDLKRLSLCTICSWNSNTFSQLTHLSLRDQEDRWRPSMPQFLNSLGSMPLLEVLCLRSAGPIITLPVSPPRRVATLLALRRVEIGCVHQPEIEAPCYILHYLRMPADVTIIISSPAMFRSATIFRHHLPPSSYISKITSFDLRMTPGQYLLLHQNHITINNSNSLESCFLLMSNLKNITDITLNRTYKLPNNHIGRGVLPSFPALRTIEIKVPSDYIPIVEALERTSQPQACPQFSQLIVCDVGVDLSAYRPASRIVLKPHREAGTTVVRRRGIGRSFQVIVRPYIESALPLRRRLL